MGEPVWIRADIVLAIHRRQLAEHGGGEGVRDEGLLASALAKPQNLLAYSEAEPDLAALAAAYAFGIARNHPFVDGNKRTAYVVCRTFLLLNGYDLAASQEEKYLAFLKLAEGRFSQEDLAGWIRARLTAVIASTPRPSRP
ncbi:MAG TPA: type II toxin-antitoxin system death-on-curing family toxin [Thermoanaerobaculia bacterium]